MFIWYIISERKVWTMKVGYVRVSTVEQNPARQEVLMEQLGVEKLFIDKATGKNTDRPQFKAMMEFVREGDVLVVESYSRLSRSTKDLLKTVDELKEKGVDFISKKESIDTTTPAGKLMLTVFAGIYQFEVENNAIRRDEGIAIAKAAGKYKGRKPIAVDEVLFTELYRQWKNGETAPKFICKKLGLSRNTFYRKVREYEVRHGIKKLVEQ